MQLELQSCLPKGQIPALWMPLHAFIQKTNHKCSRFSDTWASPVPRAPCPACPRAQGEGELPAPTTAGNPRFLRRLILDKAPLAPAQGWRVGTGWKLGGRRGSGKRPRVRPQPGSPHLKPQEAFPERERESTLERNHCPSG